MGILLSKEFYQGYSKVIMAKIWWVGWGPQVVGGWARCGGWLGDCGQDVVGGG